MDLQNTDKPVLNKRLKSKELLRTLLLTVKKNKYNFNYIIYGNIRYYLLVLSKKQLSKKKQGRIAHRIVD